MRAQRHEGLATPVRVATTNISFDIRRKDAINSDGVLYPDRLFPSEEQLEKLKNALIFVSIESVVRIDLSEDQRISFNSVERDAILNSFKVAFLSWTNCCAFASSTE